MARISMALEWFTKILKDYASWVFAWAREAGQNSLDAGATIISATVSLNSDGNTVVEWKDNGKGMVRDTLVNRFMAVGGSLKDSGNAGGFGIAKLILAFAHVCYWIRTRNLFVTGRNDEYEIQETNEDFQGLTLCTTMAGDHVVRLDEAIREWVTHTTPPRAVLFYLNGQAIRFMGKLPEASIVQDWCAIHVADSGEHGVKVRINGQYMFNVYAEIDKPVIVELTGSSLEYLTSNRDSLQWHYKDKLTKLVNSMNRDPEALFDTESDVIELFPGELGAAADPSRINNFAPTVSTAGRPVWDTTEEDMEEVSGTKVINRIPGESLPSGKLPDTTVAAPRRIPGHDMVIINKTNKAIPHKYTPSGMRPMEWRLLAKWTRIVQACASILGISRTIRTGWIFSVTAQAAHKHSSHGNLVLLNPCKLDGNEWRKGFDTSKDSFYTLVSLAVHELTHVTHSWHDESYAAKLTDNMAMIFANMATVNKAK